MKIRNPRAKQKAKIIGIQTIQAPAPTNVRMKPIIQAKAKTARTARNEA